MPHERTFWFSEEPREPGPLYALPTYTAKLALREELVGRGAAKGSFT